MAQRAGTDHIAIDLEEGASVASLVASVKQCHPEIPWLPGTLVAVNEAYAAGGQTLQQGDEVAIIPPVSGG
jgi:molybdopterin converting factor small subunit